MQTGGRGTYIWKNIGKTHGVRRRKTMAEVKWIKDLESALSLAKSEKRPVLLDFFNPG